MSPVRPNGGESLQEMIDRYNRELMKMDSHRQEASGEKDGARPAQNRQRAPRPEPDEPLYRPGERMPRPEPDEPLDEPRTPEAKREYDQGIKDILQGQRDREQGERDMAQARRDREQGEKDMAQGQRDREQGEWDKKQARRDREQGLHDMEHAREDLMRGLEELREGLRELEQLQKEYIAQRSGWEHRMPHDGHFVQPAVMTAASADSDREQWLRDLEEGRRELEQGLRDLEQGLRDKEQGEREYRQGLAERDYWINMSAQASAAMSENDAVTYPAEWQRPAPSQPGRNPDGTVPTQPTVPGRVTAQSQPGEQPMGGGYGTLIVQAYTARRAEPVAGAQVVVTMPAESGEVLYKIMRTDIDGRTPPLQLPVESAQDGRAPYAIYKVYVTADRYLPSGALNAQIFPGVTGILPVELIPGEEVAR